MALISCPECKKEISDTARACPNCGFESIKAQEIKVNGPPQVKSGSGCFTIFVAVGVFLILIIIVSAIFSNSGNSSSAPSSSLEVVSNSSWDGSVRQVEAYLKANLKDADSYKAIEWSPVNKTAGQNGSAYSVRCKYRAKNSFGGYVIENKFFFLDAQGNVLSVSNAY